MRDLIPEEVAAMWLWGKEYSQQRGSAIDFYEGLNASRKRIVDDFVRQMRQAITPSPAAHAAPATGGQKSR